MYECLCGEEFATIPKVRTHLAVTVHEDYPTPRDVVRNSINIEDPLERRIKEIEILDEESRKGFKGRHNARLSELKMLKEEMEDR